METKEDNWEGRPNNMICKTCIYYIEKKRLQLETKTAIGRCRRNAPTMKGWPVMFETDWCGEHKLDENKI